MTGQFCTACGHHREEGDRFCGRCGASAPAAPPVPAGPTAVPGTSGRSGAWPLDPPTAPLRVVARHPSRTGPATSWPGPPGGRPGNPIWTVAAFTRGDWAGAAVAVAGGVGATVVLAAASVLLLGVGDAPGVSTGNVVAMVAMLVAMAFGGSVSVSGTAGFSLTGGAASSTAGLDASPLLLTAVGLAVLATVYLRRLRSTGGGTVGALTQAVRVWALLCGVLVVVCLVGRTAPDPSLTSSFGSSGNDVPFVVTSGIAGTLFGATVWLALVLGAVLAWRTPAVLPPRVRAWRDRIAGPAAGAAVTVLLGSVLLLAGGLVAALSDDPPTGLTHGLTTTDVGQVVAVLVLAAPNLVLTALGFAAGVPLAGSATFIGAPTGGSWSLLDVTDREPVFWLAPLAVGLALVVGGLVAAVHAPNAEQARRHGWLMGPVFGVALGVVAVATAVSADGTGLGAQIGGSVHLHYVLAPLFGLAWGALGGWVGAVLAPALPVPVLRALHQHVVGARTRARGIAVPAPRTAAHHSAGSVTGQGRPS